MHVERPSDPARFLAEASALLLGDEARTTSCSGSRARPPEHRRRGYGSAVTAAVSERQLAAGRSFCFLYTDLANPTSNRIYIDIGYEPVCDSFDSGFELAWPGVQCRGDRSPPRELGLRRSRPDREAVP